MRPNVYRFPSFRTPRNEYEELPVTNEHVKMVRNVKEMAPAKRPVLRNMFANTSANNEIAKIGIVARSNCLQSRA